MEARERESGTLGYVGLLPSYHLLQLLPQRAISSVSMQSLWRYSSSSGRNYCGIDICPDAVGSRSFGASIPSRTTASLPIVHIYLTIGRSNVNRWVASTMKRGALSWLIAGLVFRGWNIRQATARFYSLFSSVWLSQSDCWAFTLSEQSSPGRPALQWSV